MTGETLTIHPANWLEGLEALEWPAGNESARRRVEASALVRPSDVKTCELRFDWVHF